MTVSAPFKYYPTLAQMQARCRYDFVASMQANVAGGTEQELIAIGADLCAPTLISAYAAGVFPWFQADEPIAWWCPDPRCVLLPSEYRPSKSLRRQAKNCEWLISINHAFDAVIEQCSLPRVNQPADPDMDEHTWIHAEMITAYTQLHHLGFAHSIEIWDKNLSLVGGLYGVRIGAVFFGESMFHRRSNASKLAFWALAACGYHDGLQLIDCQLPNPHLLSLGSVVWPRARFLTTLAQLIRHAADPVYQPNNGSWSCPHPQIIVANQLASLTPRLT